MKRRTLLAAVTAVATTPTVSATDHLDEYPYDVEENGVRVRWHDCARVSIDSDVDPTQLLIHMYHQNGGYLIDERELTAEDFPIEEFTSNCVIEDLDDAFEGGSSFIHKVAVIADGERIFEAGPPPGGMCNELAERPIDDYVLENYCDGSEDSALTFD